MGRGILADQRGEERVGVGRGIERDPAGEIDLVALAGCEQFVDAADEVCVLDRAEARGARTQLQLGRLGRGQFVDDPHLVEPCEDEIGQLRILAVETAVETVMEIAGAARADVLDRAARVVRHEPDPEAVAVDLFQGCEHVGAAGGYHALRSFADDPAIAVAHDRVSQACIHGTNGTAASTVVTVEFDPTPEQEQFRAVVRDFAQNEIAPHAEAWDRDHTFPVDTVRRMGKLGLFGLPFPEEYGGGGADYLTYCIAIEEIARVDSSMAITLEAGVSLGAAPFFYSGTEEQKQEYLVPMIAGEVLGAFGLTEAEAGSDAGATRTRAEVDSATSEWVIDGQKTFITNSGTEITKCVTITARTAPGEISNIVVDAGTPGFVVHPPYRKMGWHASDTHELSFDGCRVPVDHVLGVRGEGFKTFLRILDDGRIAIAALALGMASACLDASVAYAKQRQAFGGPIGRYQSIAFKCADMAVAVENARNLVYKAAWLREQGRPIREAAAMAKLYASEIAVTATREAVQIHGGYGFIDETPVSRFYRDAKILEIGEGTSEIQRLVLARGLGLPVE